VNRHPCRVGVETTTFFNNHWDASFDAMKFIHRKERAEENIAENCKNKQPL